MTRPSLIPALPALALAAASLALAGCDNAKPRHLPPDPFAAGPPPVGPVAAPTEGLSAGLAKRSEPAGAFLDHIGQASDPFNRPPAVTAAGQPVVLDGFGFDPVAKTPAKGVDVVIDGKAYGTAYGAARPDVAQYFKAPALVAVGFRTTLPAGALAPGPHRALIRVVATDGRGYFESPSVGFEVR
ncbi:MAG: hypothetical protein ACJ798_13555 [Phenylobacterium sp.]